MKKIILILSLLISGAVFGQAYQSKGVISETINTGDPANLEIAGKAATYWNGTKFRKWDGSSWSDLVAITGIGLVDGDKGDISVTGTGTIWTIDNNVVSNAKLSTMASQYIKGRDTGGPGDVEDLSASQVRGIIGVEDNAAADQIASEVVSTPSGNLIATDVQAAVDELQTELDGVPLEIIDEGGGDGVIVKGRNAAFFDDIGLEAWDFSRATSGTTYGASGFNSTAFGTHVKAIGQGSFASGLSTGADGNYSFAGNVNVHADSYAETAFGTYGTIATVNSASSINAADRIFSIGIGTAGGSRADGLILWKSGLFELPDYGQNTHTGTAAYFLAVDSGGTVIEEPVPTGGAFEVLNETNGDGIVITGRTAADFGNIGLNAFDISVNGSAPSSVFGATGEGAFAHGEDVQASGDNSASISSYDAITSGYASTSIASSFSITATGTSSGVYSATRSDNAGDYASIISGDENLITALGDKSVVLGGDSNQSNNVRQVLWGHSNIANSENEAVGGMFATDEAVDVTDSARLVAIGNGTGTGARSDALVIRRNGTITAPSMSNAEITTAGNTALITKDYFDVNTASGYVPYTGATADLDMGNFDVSGGYFKMQWTGSSIMTRYGIDAGKDGANSNNTAIGSSSGQNMGSGQNNTGLGHLTLNLLTTGQDNTAVGSLSTRFLIDGDNNVGVGDGSLEYINSETDDGNVALGYRAGRLYNGGNLTDSANSIFLGKDTRASANGSSNEIVIGYLAIGRGSNTTFIGGTTTTASYIKGSLNIEEGNGLFGIDDSTEGDITAYGNATTTGGSINVYNGASEDTTVGFYNMVADDDLKIMKDNTSPILVFDSATLHMTAPNSSKDDINTLGADALITKSYFDKEVIDDTTTAYELILTDANEIVTMNNASANTLTIPANSSVAFEIGTEIRIINLGAGTTTVAITTDTLNQNVGGLTLAQYDTRTLIKVTATSWIMGN